MTCISNTAHSATETLQQDFDRLQHSLFNLKLVLNADKTKYMIFSRSSNITDDRLHHITTLTGHNIERVFEYKYLGIWLDQKLTFKFHINTLASKLKQKIGYLYRNKLNFPLLCRKQIIEAVF